MTSAAIPLAFAVHCSVPPAPPKFNRLPCFSGKLEISSSYAPRKSEFSRSSFRCGAASGDSGENESRIILDAFFLGKAVAEALSERAESAVGELISTIGRLQAEQQKQLLEFQEEVLEKARRAREEAATDAQRLVVRQTEVLVVDDGGGGGSSGNSGATINSAADESKGYYDN